MTGFRARRMVPALGLTLLQVGCGLVGGRGGRLSPEQVAAAAAQDGRIRAEVEGRLAAEPSIGPGRVRVEVRGGEVELHGSVTGFGALRCAETNAGLTPGVTLVIDLLVLEPGPPTAQCRAPRNFRVAGP